MIASPIFTLLGLRAHLAILELNFLHSQQLAHLNLPGVSALNMLLRARTITTHKSTKGNSRITPTGPDSLLKECDIYGEKSI